MTTISRSQKKYPTHRIMADSAIHYNGHTSGTLRAKRSTSEDDSFKKAQIHSRRMASRKRLLPLLAIILAGMISFLTLAAVYATVQMQENDVTSLVGLPKFNYEESVASTFIKSRIRIVADVKGANMDHNESISNPCFTERSLLRRAVYESPPSSYTPLGIHTFILFNAHKLGDASFVATGIAPLQIHNETEVESCTWVEEGAGGGLIPGYTLTLYPREHHWLTYESVTVHCRLDSPVPSNTPGKLVFKQLGSTFEVYNDDGVPVKQRGPKYNIGFCSFPIYRQVVVQRIAEWVQYSYHVLGVEYFVLNDGGSIDEEGYQILKPFVNSGILEINDIRGSFQFESKHNVLILNDCIYRMKGLANWSLVLDFDEYLHIPPPMTLSSLLAAHQDKPWLTFGSLWWSVDLCRSEDGSTNFWPVERMRFHWPNYYCLDTGRGFTENHCLAHYGHRKYIYNPSKVVTVAVHNPTGPYDGGVNLETNVAFINHFQGLLRPTVKHCVQIVHENETKPEWWVEDVFLTDLIRFAREKSTMRRFAIHRKKRFD